jgi:hypothetical protein
MQADQLLQSRRDVVADRLKSLVKAPGSWSAETKRSIASYLREGEELSEGLEEERRRQDRAKENNYFLSVARNGLGFCSPEAKRWAHEHRDLSESGLGTGFATGAGVMVPVQFSDVVHSAEVYAGPMMDPSVTTIIDTPSGGSRAFPADDDAANLAVQVDEGIAVIEPSGVRWLQRKSSQMTHVGVERPEDTRKISTSQTMIPSDRMIEADASGGPVDFTLLPFPQIVVQKTDTSANPVTIVRAGSDEKITLSAHRDHWISEAARDDGGQRG